MKILWFSNCSITNTISTGSGSWLFAMRDVISNYVELYNITESNVKSVEYQETNKVKEYIIPRLHKKKDGLPSKKIIKEIKKIVKSVSPDVIHIWGLESYWAQLFAFGHLDGKVLLEIQGVLSACVNVFWGGLTPHEVCKTHRFKELIKPSIKLECQYADYSDRGRQEIDLLKKFKHISTQSKWTGLQIRPYLNENAIIYSTLRPIRSEFYQAPKWKMQCHKEPILFTSLGYNVPFKGMHVLLRALKLIVNKYPEAKLVIAGFNPNVPFYMDNGYDRLLKDYITDNDLSHNVLFPGRLGAHQIIDYLLESDVYVNPSFVESYSAATAEALFLGVPSVLSYAGALPYFSSTDQSAVFYSPLDFVDCASKIIELFESANKKQQISKNAINTLKEMCTVERVLNRQLAIYNNICEM